ncbi:hypothetical protein PUN28_005657 [Cardiocondyla obscurior]|uniref:Uncharacterized protein n=1 Tax=Cardiocondyla obscurior TaxID=286306 RepID=A0AAW2G781_9HYME
MVTLLPGEERERESYAMLARGYPNRIHSTLLNAPSSRPLASPIRPLCLSVYLNLAGPANDYVSGAMGSFDPLVSMHTDPGIECHRAEPLGSTNEPAYHSTRGSYWNRITHAHLYLKKKKKKKKTTADVAYLNGVINVPFIRFGKQVFKY